ncbi:MAG: putative selenium-dependent hydroxylase accessory protein YqeC [Deltaproteobacteria bacterium]|nr:putative selenium-dependent hydroxylase accessory protein YqeC [Deltaproteobacteria bacterium]
MFLVGAGGKTTLLFALARELACAHRVVTTTSTRILRPDPSQSPEVLVQDDVSELLRTLRAEPPGPGHRTIARATSPDGKLLGFAPEDLDRIHDAGVADVLLVEGDGAAGLPLKAHADHEPVVSARADLVVAVVAADAAGGPLDGSHVHRAHLAGERLGKGPGVRVTVADVVALFFHPRGYLRGAPGEVTVFVSRAGADPSDARALAAALNAADQEGAVRRIAIGELVRGEPWVEVMTDRPVGAP